MERFENTAQLGEFLAIQAAFVLVSLILAFAYEVYFVGRFAGTPGKLLLRMRIVRSDFSRLTYGRSAIRFFGKMLSDLPMYIGYIMVGFDPQRRALHDHIADTRVIKRDQPAAPAAATHGNGGPTLDTYAAQEDGMSVVAWQAPNCRAALVAELPPAETMTLAKAVWNDV